MTSSRTFSRLHRFSRSDKALICRKLHQNLVVRCQAGSAEPALEAYVPVLLATAERLEGHVEGKVAASTSHAVSAILSEVADAEVDHLLRIIEAFLGVCAIHKQSSYAPFARALHSLTFPQGISFVDANIHDENKKATEILQALKAPENANTLAAIKFPMSWIDELGVAIQASKQAYAERGDARNERGEQVLLGKDAEAEWLHTVTRYRMYVESRVLHGSVEMIAERERLLAPLMDAISEANAAAAARATRRAKKGETPARVATESTE